jgi:hypothetical protein
MRRSQKMFKALVFGALVCLFCCTAARSQDVAARANSAQPPKDSVTVPESATVAGPAQPSGEAPVTADPSQPSEAAATLASPPAQVGQVPAPLGGSETSDNKWHYYATGYLWIPGIHGEVGAHGFDTSIHVSGSEIFSNFRGGFLGVFTPSYNRFSAPVDFMWMRLRDSKSIPVAPNYSVRATLNFSVATPKVNVLVVDNPKIKIYGTSGVRIWHVGTTLVLVPTIGGRNLYSGPTWADFVAGARFTVPLGEKASVDVLGDAGAGGATLDYQVVGILNYQVKPKLALQAGWRYLTEHYGNNGNILNTTVQGVVFGATYKFK